MNTPRTRKQKQIEFFAANAGYATPPGRMACAKMLAEAEDAADENGWTLEHDYDDEQPYEDALGDHEYWCDKARKGEAHTHPVLRVVLYGSPSPDTPWSACGPILATLGAVIDPSVNYLRVLRAELASEVLGEAK